jgi:NADPH-dependent 2,4-dienoyl-CoA reductase/sulfur reductase-like enzyme
MPKPFVAIGGDAAGLSAASKCKREDPDREVIVYEKGEWISYAHCGMPSYVKGEVDSLGDLLSLSPDEVTERGIDLRRTHEITAIDTEAGVVRGEGPELQRLDLAYAPPFSPVWDPVLVAAKVLAGTLDE